MSIACWVYVIIVGVKAFVVGSILSFVILINVTKLKQNKEGLIRSKRISVILKPDQTGVYWDVLVNGEPLPGAVTGGYVRENKNLGIGFFWDEKDQLSYQLRESDQLKYISNSRSLKI